MSEVIKSKEEQQIDDIMYLAAIGWADEELRKYLGISAVEYDLLLKSDSPVAKAIETGKYRKRAAIEVKIAQGAEAGDIDYIKQFQEVVRTKAFSISKLDLFGGAEKSGAFERIQEYIASGAKGDLGEQERLYIDLLTMVYSLDGQYGKRRTIKFLTSSPFDFSYSRASEVYSDAIEMFFSNRNISKDALRNKIADQFDSLYIAARNAAQSTKDYEIASNILANKARALQLDKEDAKVLPSDVYLRQYRVLSLNPESIGLKPANRDELARQIDNLTVSQSTKDRLKMEAGVKDVDIIKIIDDVSQEEN